MRRLSLLSLAACGLVVLFSACPPVDQTADGGGGRQRNPSVDAGSGSFGEKPPSDAGAAPLDTTRAADCPADVAWVAQINGSVRFDDETPAEGAKVQTCVRTNAGQLLCLSPVDASAEGAFSATIPSTARCMHRATSRVLLPLTDNGTLYCEVELPLDAAVVDLDFDYTLFGTTPATTLPERGDESAVRTVVFADGLEIDVIPQQTFGDDYARLAAVAVAGSEVPSCVHKGTLDFEAAYWFSPEGDVAGRFAMRIPNQTGLPAGTPVELWVQGGLTCAVDDTTLEEAAWMKFGTAEVDADGATITVDAENGLPCLGTFGYTVAP